MDGSNPATLFRMRPIALLVGMNEPLKTFADNVNRLMRHQDVGPAKLAKLAGISNKTLNNVLNGRHATQADILTAIADALKVQIWMLWLPYMPVDAKSDRIIQSLIETSAQLSEDAIVRIARMAELELNAERSAVKNKKTPPHLENHPKR